ncbi:MAG: protein-L-isoaspartate(D-aspartate) O-methyltransferase [Chloroflexota bacterium]
MNFEVARRTLMRHLSLSIQDKKVIEVMSRIPRELFVPPEIIDMAYEDRPLPIGAGQTISQPYIVALMTEALQLTGSEKVLEVGTGSGYQAAILAEMAGYVVTVERLPQLAEVARRLLEKLGYKNVEVHVAEETLGWEPGAPYDAIMVTAGAPGVPDELVAQLAVQGRMVIPVGSRYDQDLLRVVKTETGVSRESLAGCRFVPLVGEGAWQEE